MHTYPSDERQISDVERGRSCEAIVAQPSEGTLVAGDSVLFALAVLRPGHLPSYVKGGDSVLVLLSGVTDLGTTDPVTGQALVRIAWEPPRPSVPTATAVVRGAKSLRSPRVV